jgi:hypothetical protein
MKRSAMGFRLLIVFVSLWLLAALLELGHPHAMMIAPIAPIYFGLSSLWRGDLDVAIVSLGLSALTLVMTVFAIATRRALWAAVTSVVLYWCWSLVLQGISA